ncbi:unnamed protein product [Phytomonas sp. EM1]|nr:unnamed protein product [Phytomonas sp. EM1]|eukprot:CCW61671.1 unnamed protein product [Phytomonas sp. isolate EM1]
MTGRHSRRSFQEVSPQAVAVGEGWRGKKRRVGGGSYGAATAQSPALVANLLSLPRRLLFGFFVNPSRPLRRFPAGRGTPREAASPPPAGDAQARRAPPARTPPPPLLLSPLPTPPKPRLPPQSPSTPPAPQRKGPHPHQKKRFGQMKKPHWWRSGLVRGGKPPNSCGSARAGRGSSGGKG